MKTITAHEHELIQSAIGEGLTALGEAVLEKDLLITQVLQVVQASDKDGVGLVFCGGTCLSKAYGLIDRMSEDIDFKLVVPQGLSLSACSKVLSQYKKRLVRDLMHAGFDVPADEVVASAGNNYVSMNLYYESCFPQIASLRPAIKLELSARPPLLPTVLRSIDSMLNSLIQAPSLDLQVECVSVDETLAEKVLSFLRRTAEMRAGRNRVEYDDRLVRHLYDVRAISLGRGGMPLPTEHFVTLVAGDAAQYRNQYPEFDHDPVGQMRSVLDVLNHDASTFERDYQQFVDELVFGEPVLFDEARSVFVELAERFLSAMSTSQKSRNALQRMADNARELGLDY